MSVCRECQRGNHQHDRLVSNGGDAGCPNQGISGRVDVPCECTVVVYQPYARPGQHGAKKAAPRKPTVEEAEAMLTLIRGGWLRLELTLDESLTPAEAGQS